VRGSLGVALLADGKAREAEAVFREDLRGNPRNPRSLFGLKQCLSALHEDAGAAWVERQFREVWKNSDVQLQIGDLQPGGSLTGTRQKFPELRDGSI
jgi:hypothetical protein